MLHRFRGRKVATLLCAAWLSAAHAAGAAQNAAAADTSAAAILSADKLPAHFTGDDPGHVRDALSGRPAPSAPPSLVSRARNLLAHPWRSVRAASGALHASAKPSAESSVDNSAKAQPDRTFVFAIPVSYGVRYEAKKKMLSVNVSLAAADNPSAILLKETVKGQSGRKLVIAPEAKAKGFIQNIDEIQLTTGDNARTNIRSRVLVPDYDASGSGHDLAILLVCTLEPPFLRDRVEHSDPTDEEPTDITRRTSMLTGQVDAVWLFDRTDGTVVTRRLRLVK